MNPFDFSPAELAHKAATIREHIIRMLLSAGSGHAAGPLGMSDVFAVLYFSTLHHDPLRPDWEERDRLVLSCGHICPVLYASLAEAGYFPIEELVTLRSFRSRLQGHPSRIDLPGIETSSGPLGQGISQAIGMALALRQARNPGQVFCVMSDGEHNEGQVWEAAMLANKYALGNLTVILDRNDIQIDGFTHDVMPLAPLREKYESFGWHVIEIDGNDIVEILQALDVARAIDDRPVVIIAHTIPGKGVRFMEGKFEWHGKAPNDDEAYQAMLELRTLGGKIRTD